MFGQWIAPPHSNDREGTDWWLFHILFVLIKIRGPALDSHSLEGSEDLALVYPDFASCLHVSRNDFSNVRQWVLAYPFAKERVPSWLGLEHAPSWLWGSTNSVGCRPVTWHYGALSKLSVAGFKVRVKGVLGNVDPVDISSGTCSEAVRRNITSVE